MKNLLTAAMAAITLGGAVCATAAPAEARPHGYYGGGYGGGYYRHDNTGAAVAAGVVGLALGAALASNHGYYNRGYYGGGYYPAYGYAYAPAPAYRVCESTRWVWDPYIGRRVPVASRYAC